MAKKIKAVRQTLASKLEEARTAGFKDGFQEGAASGRREFLPSYDARPAILDFIRSVEAWPLEGNAVVSVVATDMKCICNLNMPARTMQVLAAEMKRRLV